MDTAVTRRCTYISKKQLTTLHVFFDKIDMCYEELKTGKKRPIYSELTVGQKKILQAFDGQATSIYR